ncbi:hypothetical protein A3860_36575 [Niastella vici]|uniref:Glycosyltransferase RgtA/B/C/D-like domain-containing protein n=1 Tax=Niastella vici TaxID=1703345 RepID=A0A1V9FMX2_9BACT|nr:hypothetical protein [Niastella vici]OQP59688.1 hypothetical protein A3860_36575 [Niastella vici]
MLFKQTISTLPYNQWLTNDTENKRLLRFCAIVMIISFAWIKYVYPYPNFMPPDSFSYIKAAADNEFINMWPIGYSKFLRLISVFTHSDITLVTLQYFLLIASVLYFLFTVRYLLSPGKWLFRIVFTISIANPLLPHIANFVSSDCLFASLSLTWFTQLLWILYKQKLLIIHAVIITLALMTRFSALYYPLVSLLIIFIIPMSTKTRRLGMFAIIILLLGFISRTQYEYKVKTGTAQFSAFGGWQLAANALYGYAYSQRDEEKDVPYEFRLLHSLVNDHMDSIRHAKNRPDSEPGIYYLWDFKSPLVIYLHRKIPPNSKIPYFYDWSTVAPLYGKYGRWLTMQHPVAYLKHYAWPNLLRYYSPPPYFMGVYNMGNNSVDPITTTWFQWKNNRLSNRYNDAQIHIMNVFPVLLAIINPAYIVCILFFFAFGGIRHCNNTAKRIIACVLLVWLSNTLFSVISAPIELRYQIFPIVTTLPFFVLFLAWLIQSLIIESKPYKKHGSAIPKPTV